LLENLKTTKFRDGTPIQNVTDKNTWLTHTTPAYCNYNNNNVVVSNYGRLYNYKAIIDKKKYLSCRLACSFC
jgi:hypothetical protein